MDVMEISVGRLLVHLDALAENWMTCASQSNSSICGAAVKANAYGVGMIPAVLRLWEAGCRDYFVAHLKEALILRQTLPDARIVILHGLLENQESFAREHRLEPALCSLEQVESWKQKGGGHPAVLHIDTGMSRLGLRMEEGERLLQDVIGLKKLGVRMIMSHLACAEEKLSGKNADQLRAFQYLTAALKNEFSLSFANSAGIFLGADYHFDVMRPGIALYGSWPIANVVSPLKTVVELDVPVIQVRLVKKGETIGYSATFQAKREMQVAILAYGYADGLRRTASSDGQKPRCTVDFNGHKLPVVGRVSMDLTAVDASAVNEGTLKQGDYVQVFGRRASIDEFSRGQGTIAYELLTNLGQRFERHYV